MTKKWEEGVTVVDYDRNVVESEEGFYWYWKGSDQARRCSKRDYLSEFHAGAIYKKVDATCIDSPPPKPEPIVELEDGLYWIRGRTGFNFAAEKTNGRWDIRDGLCQDPEHTGSDASVIGRIPVEPV